MPTPGENETKDEFLERCIPIVLDDGTAESNDQAVAICARMWEEGAKSSGYSTIKAVGDGWELDVLAVPYGGPNGGKDSHKEYFSPETELYLEQFKSPLVVYYHGYDDNNKPMGKPVVIGKVKGLEKRADGTWARIVLDKLSKFAAKIREAALAGMAKASSGTIVHLMRRAADGLITHWPLAEISLIDERTGNKPANAYAVALPVMKAMYEQAGIDWPDTAEAETPETEAREPEGYSAKVAPDADGDNSTKSIPQEEIEMDEKDLLKLLDERDARKAAEAEAERKAKEERQAEIDAAVKKAREEEKKALEEEAAKSSRLPGIGKAPHVTKFDDIAKFDNIGPEDIDMIISVLEDAKGVKGVSAPSAAAYKALAVRLEDDKRDVTREARSAMKAAGVKSNELNYSTYSGYGDQWVGVAYSNALWEAIRVGTFVINRLPQIEVPQGYESITLPIESTDPTFYKVSQATSHDATMLFPTATVTSSKMATGNVSLTLAKMGARVPWTGEMQEDSLIPWVSQLRMQLANAGAEYMEHVLIDGDTATTASTNINDIADSDAQAGTEVYLLTNGFRKSPLVTTTANSRDGGALAVEDFLETLKLMGSAGINALDRTKVGFILDVNTHWKALELDEVKTRDVFSGPTLENGVLTGIWGYPVNVSAQMHRSSAVRKANSSGKVDQTTTTNNTKGAILAVRWDQWRFGWRRRMTMETTRYPRSDSYEITALARFGLIQRDTEASAITYNITV